MKLRYIISLILLLSGCMAGIKAQLAVGSWKTYATFASIDKVVDTPQAVYYLTCGQLYSRDKDNDETYNYSAGGKLSDSGISSIYYNYDRKYLLVVYSNSNIDIIDSDERVYNMPDIMDATLDVVPVVNDVDFDGDRIYMATNFGAVIFDSRKKEVVTAGDYGKNMISVVVLGDKMWFVEGYKYYCADKNSSLTSASSLKLQPFGYTTKELVKLNDETGVLLGLNVQGNNTITVIKPVEGNNEVGVINQKVINGLKNFQRMADGRVLAQAYNTICIVESDGTINTTSIAGTDMETKKVGSVYETKYIASCKGLDELWLGSDAGLSCYSIKNGEITVLSEAARPDDALTFNIIGRLYKGPSGAIYASSHGFSQLIGTAVNPDNNIHNLFYINKIENEKIKDITPVKYGTKNRNHKPYSSLPVGFKSGYQVLEDPKDSSGYIVGNYWDGFYYFKDKEEVVHYYEDNSTMQSVGNGYRLQANGMDFDKYGNLWTSQFLYKIDDSFGQFHMLPSDKVGKETTKNDWNKVKDVTSVDETGQDGNLIVCKHSDNVIYIDGTYINPICVVKTKGTPSLSDDILVMSSELVDQDNNKFTYTHVYAMDEDHNGKIWLGTDNGVIEITDPDAITGSSFKVNHLKVPRNDGTNFADYLLDGEKVCAVAVDPSNRKWLATLESGVYLVSEDGDEIIEYFDPTNSPLPDYAVYSVVCDDSNGVYFGTGKGLYRYSGTSAPAKDNFNDVYAYPNPVRPDYTGWITITGLMDNSLVKIADAAGNVFYQGTSEGGMLVWDGCDSHGRRVKTGVYYVFASHGGDGIESSGAVTKIMVVN